MLQLEESKGIPRKILLMMAIVSGLTVANLYYNQPLLEDIRKDIGINELQANLYATEPAPLPRVQFWHTQQVVTILAKRWCAYVERKFHCF